MMPENLTPDERQYLLNIARQALQNCVFGKVIPRIDLKNVSPRLQELGASFVTLTRNGELRGCIGALEAYQSLAEDVQEHTVAAAMDDYRFQPVQPVELDEIKIEISRLTPPMILEYNHPDELPQLLHPGIDGVILRDGTHRATFLPQVWEKIPNMSMFLSQLCMKMGASPDLWKRRNIMISTYQVEEFHE